MLPCLPPFRTHQHCPSWACKISLELTSWLFSLISSIFCIPKLFFKDDHVSLFGQKTLMAPQDLQTNIKNFYRTFQTLQTQILSPHPGLTLSAPPPPTVCVWSHRSTSHSHAQTGFPALRRSWLVTLSLSRLPFPLPALAMKCYPSSKLGSSPVCDAFPGPGPLALPPIQLYSSQCFFSMLEVPLSWRLTYSALYYFQLCDERCFKEKNPYFTAFCLPYGP